MRTGARTRKDPSVHRGVKGKKEGRKGRKEKKKKRKRKEKEKKRKKERERDILKRCLLFGTLPQMLGVLLLRNLRKKSIASSSVFRGIKSKGILVGKKIKGWGKKRANIAAKKGTKKKPKADFH